MKRLLLLLVPFFAFLSLSASPTQAVPAGDPCCRSGYTYISDACLDTRIFDGCEDAANTICDAPNIIGQPSCGSRNLMTTLCRGAFTTAAHAANFNAAATCSVIVGLIPNPLGAVHPIVQPICETALNALVVILPDFITAFQCDPRLICHPSGICALSPANRAFCDPSNPESGIETALGCIPTQGTAFVTALLSWAVGLAGGIAFVLIVYSGFLMLTSAGDPKRVAAGRELLTNSLAGLALIALSVVLLNFIGLNILNLGGLGFNV